MFILSLFPPFCQFLHLQVCPIHFPLPIHFYLTVFIFLIIFIFVFTFQTFLSSFFH
ncbi:unnamed protein product [Meloidogyne enterolobii]|uniref:Uncharacterized protein n=1 Tax=Meloidogyne enterolobii TaxID=390850 RepID=A0ACB1AAT8_MELEN